MKKIVYSTMIATIIALCGSANATAAPTFTPFIGQILVDAPPGETWNCLLGTTGPTPYSGVRNETIVGPNEVWTVWVPPQVVHIACISASVPFLVFQSIPV